jgi:hypothetical protein
VIVRVASWIVWGASSIVRAASPIVRTTCVSSRTPNDLRQPTNAKRSAF